MAEVGADIIEETGVLVALAPFVVKGAKADPSTLVHEN
jgi:hypothetical protein